MSREEMLIVARKLREVLTECEVTKQEAESIAYILLRDIKNSNETAQKTYMENTKLQSVTDLNQEREFSQIIDGKVASGKMTINEARKLRGLPPLEEEFDVKLFTAKKDKLENTFQIKIKLDTRGLTYEKLNEFLDKRIIPLREKYPFADIYMDIEA